MDNFINEVPKHRKRKNKKKAPKANHKHIYEEVIGLKKSKHNDNKIKAYPYQQCSICQKLTQDKMFFSIDSDKYGMKQMLFNYEEVKKHFPNLREIIVDE